jgi:hypothetical protein
MVQVGVTWKTIIERLRLRLNAIEYSGKLWTYKVPIFDLLFAMCADMLTSPRAGVNTDSEEGRDIQPPHAGALLHPRHHRRYRACAPSFSTHISFSPNYFTPFLIGAGGKKTDKESPQLGPADELRLMTSEQLSEKKKRRISIDTLKSKLLLGTSIFYTRLSRKKKQANSPMVLLFCLLSLIRFRRPRIGQRRGGQEEEDAEEEEQEGEAREEDTLREHHGHQHDRRTPPARFLSFRP